MVKKSPKKSPTKKAKDMSNKDSQYNKDLKYLIQLSDLYYSTGTSTVSDNEFDKLVDEFERLYNTEFNYIGKATHNKIKLPVNMPSLNKAKDENAIRLFLNRTSSSEFIISSKIDGISCLLVVDNKKINLYTRGNGEIGTDITHLLPLINIPKKFKDSNIIIRGELVFSKTTFNSLYDNTKQNARNVLSGIINGNTIDPNIINKIMFIGYSIPSLPIEDAFDKIIQLKLIPSYHNIYDRKDITIENLTHLIKEYSKDVDYEMDGIVISSCNVIEDVTIDNPKLSIAFKILKDKIQTKVIDIEWNISRYGILHPKAILEPVWITGVTISNATAFNAKFVKDNKLGKGAIVTIIRSGDVIPYILSIDKPSNVDPFPKNYVWIDELNIKPTDDAFDYDKLASKFENCMEILNIKGVKEMSIKKFIDVGIIREEQLFGFEKPCITKEFLLSIDGIKEKSATNIYNALQEGKNKMTLSDLLLMSTFFNGFGEKKIKNVIDNIDILSNNEDKNIILKLEELGLKTTASKFIDGMKLFIKRYKNSPLLDFILSKETGKKECKKETNRETKGIICFSGFRDNILKTTLESNGYIIEDDVTKKTTLLLVKELDSSTSKTVKAIKYNVPIQLVSDFKAL